MITATLNKDLTLDELAEMAKQVIDWRAEDDRAVNLTTFQQYLTDNNYILVRKNFGCDDGDFVELTSEDLPDAFNSDEPFQIWKA